MDKVCSKAKFLAVFGLSIFISALSGCSMFSPTNTPIDCNLVKAQASAGKNDMQIAEDLGGVSVDKVEACHGPESTGNKSAGMIPSNY